MADGALTDPALNRSEHIDENVSLKRVGNYNWDGANWVRATSSGVTLPSSLVNGQISVTSTRAAFPSNALSQGITIEALSTNAVSVFVGNSTVTASSTAGGIELPPGAAVTILVSNSNLLYVITASSTATASFVGS